MLEKHCLKRRSYYVGTSRNTRVAMWDGVNFLFINYNFIQPYLETINYFGDVINKTIDGFIPIEEITIPYPPIHSEKIKYDYKNSFRNVYKNINTSSLQGEIWLSIDGYDNKYSVSNYGRVRKNNPLKIMKQNINRGYLVLGLTSSTKIRKTYRVHTLVAITFKKDDYKDGLEVNHINGVCRDNRDTNLEWISHSLNSQKTFALNNRVKKLCPKDVIEIRKLLKEGVRGITISEKFNISPSTVSEINTRKKWVLF